MMAQRSSLRFKQHQIITREKQLLKANRDFMFKPSIFPFNLHIVTKYVQPCFTHTTHTVR
jgi:hypothetical protein